VAPIVVDRLTAHVVGQARKRGLIPRVPAGDRLLVDATAWLTAQYADAIRSIHRSTLPTGETELAVDLHPAAPPLLVTASDTGRVAASGETASAGPGYHRLVGRILARLGTEMGIEWVGGDSTTTFAGRPAVEHAYLAWLGPQLTRARDAARRGESGIHLAMPPGTKFMTDQALATVVGPRDEMWLDSAVADPRVAIDITPWWADATDGRYLLNRALILMWLEARWRPPAVPGEADLLDEIHRLLSRAFPSDPGLAYPWHAWAELCAYRGIDDAMARQAAARAAAQAALEPEPVPLVGYRRDPVCITHEGWSLEVPGSYAERRTRDEWWAGGPGRSITLAATRTRLADGAPMPAEAFIAQFAAELGADALTHRDGEVLGRARLSTDASSGVEIAILEGYSAVAGSGAVIRIEFDDAADWRWALDLWRSLRPV
jgi:hypothetical protein